MFLNAHLADLLSAGRRSRVRFKTRSPRWNFSPGNQHEGGPMAAFIL